MQVNYSLKIENLNPNDSIIMVIGPFLHIGPGVVPHVVYSGLDRDKNYSMKVELNSIAGESESEPFYFGKSYYNFYYVLLTQDKSMIHN